MSKDKTSGKTDDEIDFHGYFINEQGEEVLITEEMMSNSMAKIKLKSIGAHTGYTKAITDKMVEEYAEE